MANGWKITAIIFIILFILETAFFFMVAWTGMKELDEEDRCGQICSAKESDGYRYENDLCSCYSDGKVVYQDGIK